ncbi:MAG: DEAD/DEAH box helicase family protein, partial [Bacteroides sp.]|nr:DEAD/DEAH box helicase family protein [Bacteroides sp.]
MAYFITQTRILYVLKVNDRKHAGLLKIGEIFVEESEAREYEELDMLKDLVKEKLDMTTWAQELNYEVVLAESTTYSSVKGDDCYKARTIIDILSDSGYSPQYLKSNEKKLDLWMPVKLSQVNEAIESAKSGRKTIEGKPMPGHKPIDFRPEQKEAINAAIDKFSTKTGRKFLWNAKMRFGKTLSALEVARRLGETDPKKPNRPLVKTVLIVTHRPVVDRGWRDDFYKIFFDQLDTYKYGSRNLNEHGSVGDFYSLTKDVEKGKRLVFFVSMQFLRLSNLVGGGNDDPLKRDIMNYAWDMVVVDEAHEGTKTLRGQNVIERLKKDNTVMLSLSGTPFNLYDDFKEEEIYTWDYVKEQRAKVQWEEEHYGDPNPYAELPHMNLFTFDLSKIMRDNEDADTSDFRFNEFFRTWTGEIKKDGEKLPSKEYIGRFIHESAVNDFLDMLVKEDCESNYPYSTEEFRNKFKHTFWIVPGVKEAAALEKLLKKHPVFENFKIVNVAGDGNIEDPNGEALQEVQDAIKNNDYTITLSCGKLTTGVSVPQWTAVFYLKGSEMTTAATYMQTIFRVQTHAVLDGEQKRECYVFDFAPSRALRVVAETAKMAVRAKGSGAMGFVKGTQEEEEEELGEFLKFCPVISLEEGGMIPYEPSRLFAQLKDVYVARAVQSGYADNSLYSSETLVHLGKEAIDALDRISGKIGTTPNLPKPDTIDVGYKPMTDEEKATAKKAEKKKKQKKELTPEEKEALDKKRAEREQKKARISVLRGLSIRIPLLVYGAEIADGQEDTELSISNFTTLVDQASWDEFMPAGITKDDFDAIRDSYDPVIFREAAKRIRSLTRAADLMDVEERIERIATVFSYFHNPDKETVLTPWRVVNMHLSDTIGGWSFYNEDFSQPNIEIRNENGTEVEYKWPRFVNQGVVTADVFGNYDARLLEINSKTGLYPLYLTYSLYKLWKTEYVRYGLIDKAERDDKVIWDSILNDNIFVVCKTPMARAITRRTLVGFRRHDDGREIQVNAVCPYWVVNKAELVKKKVIKVNEKERVSSNDSYRADLVEVLRYDSKIFERDVVRPEWWETVDPKANIKLDRNIFKNMIKFDAVVGNPPYQIQNEGIGNGADPVYHLFINAGMSIAPTSTMIHPARFLFNAGKTPKSWNEMILSNPHFKISRYWVKSMDVFPTADIKGGVAVSLHNKFQNYGAIGTFSAYGELIDILKKVSSKSTMSFSSIVGPREAYGLTNSLYEEHPDLENRQSEGHKYSLGANIYEVMPEVFYDEEQDGLIAIYGRYNNTRGYKWIKSEYINKPDNFKYYKVFVPEANGTGAIGEVLSTPVIGVPVIG